MYISFKGFHTINRLEQIIRVDRNFHSLYFRAFSDLNILPLTAPWLTVCCVSVRLALLTRWRVKLHVCYIWRPTECVATKPRTTLRARAVERNLGVVQRDDRRDCIKTARRDWSEQTSRGEPGGKAAGKGTDRLFYLFIFFLSFALLPTTSLY